MFRGAPARRVFPDTNRSRCTRASTTPRGYRVASGRRGLARSSTSPYSRPSPRPSITWTSPRRPPLTSTLSRSPCSPWALAGSATHARDDLTTSRSAVCLMKARAPPFERDPGVPAEGVPPRRHCRAPTRPRTSALYGAEAPSERARAPRARDCMPARASTCDGTYIFAAVQFALPSSGARRRRGAALRADRRQPTHPPSTVPLVQGHRGGVISSDEK